MRNFFAVIILMAVVGPSLATEPKNDRPNILFVFSDDHALQAISAYGGRFKGIAPTPNIDRIAREGALFQNSFCANSICGPSRACILTGKHSSLNGFRRNTDRFDGSQWSFQKDLRASGYTTALIGKWHLGGQPQGFDHWEIFPGQGNYYSPDFITMDGRTHRETGYATDLVTDKTLAWLDYLDAHGLADNTIVIYSSDQGLNLGEHGWYDKRWMYEESLKMPFVIRWPGLAKPGSRPDAMIQNIDYAPTFLEAAGLPVPDAVQGKPLVSVLRDSPQKPEGWRNSIYYHYFEVGEHNVPEHDGVRTKTHKLIHFSATDRWQLFDLESDPNEMVNLYGTGANEALQKELHRELESFRLQYDGRDVKDSP